MTTIRFLLIILFLSSSFVQAQSVNEVAVLDGQAETVTIEKVSVEGIHEKSTKDFLLRACGLRPGQEVLIPGDPAIAVAIRAIYRLGQFSHVEIKHEKLDENAIHVIVNVTSFPRLGEVYLSGLSKKDERDLRKEIDLLPALQVRPADIKRTKQRILHHMQKKGYHLSTVTVKQIEAGENVLDLNFDVESGPQFRVREVSIIGNKYLSDRQLKHKMKTQERVWWRFWEKARFDIGLLEDDLENMLAFMHEKGFYDAQIIRDTLVIQTEADRGLYIQVDVGEGVPYYIESVTWEGNTLFTDAQLSAWLGLKGGDRYNLRKLEENLYGNARGQDISSQYMNLGYMRFGVEPTISVVGDNTLALHFDVQEGQAYAFGEIEITGNHTTKDHVVRRELFSLPGERFSRSAIQESIRRLMQAGYFSDGSLSAGPGITIDDDRKLVNLRYDIEETNFPRPQLTGSIGQFGLVMGLNFTYNNFSLQEAFKGNKWRFLPSGDGQQIGLNVQANGGAYQQYGFNFTEPWFRGKPAPLGFATSYTHIGSAAVSSELEGSFNTFSARIFHDRRLKWPSPFFNVGSTIEYRAFNNAIYDELPGGRNQALKVTQSISRNTTNHPLFPVKGSHNRFSVEIGLPVKDFVQYHKWRLQSSWNLPLSRNGRFSANASADLGYIGSLNGGEVAFERFVLGGSPLDSQGLSSTPVLGTDVVYFRGYPLGAFNATTDAGLTGQRLLSKYTTELRWMAVKQPQIQMMPYAFFDAANTWNSFKAFNATSLFRSAGFGIRMNLPMIGMVDVAYGRNLDSYLTPEGSNQTGLPGWGIQFSIGQPFNF